MLRIVLLAALLSLVQAQRYPYEPGRILNPFPSNVPKPEPLKYRLCTFTNLEYDKCIHTVHIAQNNSIDLQLDCVRQDTRETCLNSVRAGRSDMIILSGHGYQAARKNTLVPIIYGKDDSTSLNIAVAKSDLTITDYLSAAITVDESNHRAFDSAVFFNLQRGHDICRKFNNAADDPTIQIVDSAQFTATDDDILLCANGTIAKAADYQSCNVEASLQRAVFVSLYRSQKKSVSGIKRIFDTILERFGPGSTSFNFFNTFEDSKDVLFRDNTIAFEVKPSYRNGIDESKFNSLHCNRANQPHDPSQLE